MRLSPPAVTVPLLFATATILLTTGPAAAQLQFQDQTTTRLPASPDYYTNYAAVADIDDDGDLDIILANGGNFGSQGSAEPIQAMINNGTGNFSDESATRIGFSGSYRGVSLGDCDGDGDLDIIASQDFNSRPRLLLNDGNGFFADATVQIPASPISSTRAQFADIDNDGDLDIYINNGGAVSRFGCGQNKIWINDGTGTYTDETNTRHPLGNVCEPMDIIFGDIDNDFDLDIRTGNRGSNNSKLYRNGGDATGVFSIVGGVTGDSSCYSYDFGDINGDGNLDMLGANAGPANQELLLRNTGGGSFVNVSGNISPNTSGDDNDSKFFDLDNDGDMDMIIAALFQSREKVYINNGTGSYALNSTIISSNNDASLDVSVADFDGDGDLDIFTSQGEGGSFQNRIYININGPADTIAPSINTESIGDTCNTDGPYVVRALIYDGVSSDRGFFDDGVVLEYSVDGGKAEQVEMRWSGNSLYRGEIPGVQGGSVTYRVIASDFAGNIGTGADETFDVEFQSGDVNGDTVVNVDDLNEVIIGWGDCPGDPTPCPADVTCNGVVDVNDLVRVIVTWD